MNKYDAGRLALVFLITVSLYVAVTYYAFDSLEEYGKQHATDDSVEDYRIALITFASIGGLLILLSTFLTCCWSR